jgi:hypothetical protein
MMRPFGFETAAGDFALRRVAVSPSALAATLNSAAAFSIAVTSSVGDLIGRLDPARRRTAAIAALTTWAQAAGNVEIGRLYQPAYCCALAPAPAAAGPGCCLDGFRGLP